MSEIRADTINNASGDNDSGLDLSTNDQVDIKIAGSLKARVNSSGNLLVGTTNSSVESSSTDEGVNIFANKIGVARDGGVTANFNRLTSDGDIMKFRKDGTTVGSIGTVGGDLIIGTGDTGLFFNDSTNQIHPYNIGALSGGSVDGAIDLGQSGVRFDDIYATNGTIQTSDRNEKQDIEELSEAEQRVAVVAKGLIRKYRWRDAVAEKGDNARTHFGIIAQDLQDAFTAEGLDASDYAMFTSNTWWEKEISVDAVEADEENGIEAQEAYTYRKIAEEATEGYTERTRLGVRYNQLLAFIISAL